jgi:predicted phage terminase large subunit-like protein
MKLTSDLIYGFATSLLSERYDNPKPTPQFHRELWEYCCSDHSLVAIAAPRGHAKSTAVTHAYTLAAVLFRQADFVVLVSDTELQAVQFLNDIKMELYENQKLRGLFKIADIYKDAEREIRFKMGADNHQVRIMARGASGGSGSVRGFKWRGKRPNLIICDDMENDEAVSNEERRDKFRNWFYGALIPALSDTGQIRLVGTVLHFDSLLERLMPETTGDEAKYTVKERLKEYSLDKTRAWHSIKYRAHTDFDDFEDVLWPEKFNEVRLTKLRNDFVKQGISEGYAQEYLNYPIHEGDAFFRKNDFVPMAEDDFDLAKVYYASIDFAISEKDKRSYSVITVGGVDQSGVLHIVDVIRQRMDAKQIIDEMMAVQIRYQPDLFVVEEGALKKAIGPFLKDEMLRQGIFINLHPMVPYRDKLSRARAIQGRMRQGGVHFDKESEWFPSFEQELLRFDRGQYDDQVDSIAWLGLVLNQMITAPTEEEQEEMDWDEEYNETVGSMQMGRSQITGY